MSGIEAAGIALAAVPLCIKAVSTCSDVRRFGRLVVDWKVRVRRSRTELRSLRDWLIDIMRTFLRKALPEEEVNIMLQDPLGDPWKRQDLRNELFDIYGVFLEEFESAVELILEGIKEILYELGLCDSPNVRNSIDEI